MAGRRTDPKDQQREREVPPDRRPLTEVGAERLAKLSGLSAKELAGLDVAEIREKYAWRIDPELLFFRRVCGQVVKKDPVTGVEYPVPYATVHIEDTDCGLLGFFPPDWPFGWYFPLFCRREEIGTVKTDGCGRFCVFVPRFEIDWILRFRRGRICFPTIFIRPSIAELLDRLRLPIRDWPPRRPPIPEPDPPPLLLEDGGLALRRAQDVLGPALADRVATAEASAALGAVGATRGALQAEQAFRDELPPPLPRELREQLEQGKQREVLSARIAKTAPDAPDRLEAALDRLDVRRYIGPFWRCRDVFIPEWVPIVDVPDVTFRVTQDVDGDGDEEVVYSEGYFDVRWNAGPIPDVKLLASENAVAAPLCDGPEVPCEDEPAIVLAGLMPLHNPPAPADPYHDNGTGYARRPNRPHPSGAWSDPLPNPLATAPFTGTIQLYGCVHGMGGAFYRLRYSHDGAPSVPFLNLTWKLFRLGPGNVLQTYNAVPDGGGWYEILDPADGWLPSHLLLNWPTGQNGYYEIELDLGNPAKNVINTSDAVGIRVDNSNPAATFTKLEWRVLPSGAWDEVDHLDCPVIFRPPGSAIELRASYQASAQHFRSLRVTAGGCGVPGATVGSYWHTDALDNSVAGSGVFTVPGGAPPGTYSFLLDAHGRAFNPAGGDGGVENDWEYDPVYRRTYASLNVAVIPAPAPGP